MTLNAAGKTNFEGKREMQRPQRARLLRLLSARLILWLARTIEATRSRIKALREQMEV